MSALVDSVEFRATSSAGSLPGLDGALAKLRAIKAELEAINGKLSGLSTMSAFKRTKEELEAVLKGTAFSKTKTAGTQSVAQALGVPDIKDFEAFVGRWKAAHRDMARTTFKGGEFASPGQAAKLARSYFTSAAGRAKDQVEALQSLFGKGQGNNTAPAGMPALPVGAAVSGSIPLIIPASQIVATVSGPIVVSGPGGGTGPTRGPARGPAKAGTPYLGGTVAGALLEERVTTSSKGRLVQQKELIKAGETIDKFFEEVEGALQPIKEVTTSSSLKRAKEKLAGQVAGIKAELAAVSPKSKVQSPESVAAIYRKQADMMESFVTGKPGKELGTLGQGTLITRTLGQVNALRTRAADLEQKQMVMDAQKVFTIREQLGKAREKGDKDEAARLNSERRQFEKRMVDRNRMTASRARSDEAATKMADKVRDKVTAERDAGVRRSISQAAAHGALGDFLTRGGRIVSDVTTRGVGKNGPTESRTVQAVLENSTEKRTLTATFDAAGASVRTLRKDLSETRAEAGYLGSDFLKNTAKVTAWAASVGVLYKSIELARFSLTQLVEIGPQIARLEQVFKGVGGTAHELAVDTLEVAAINGQSTKEAMEAAIQWSRLGLTRVQVNEAVRVSTMAANVAQITELEATEKLQAVMQTYGLRVGELRGTLGEMVQISNIYNATNADMLEGLSRTAAVAKQAGLPLVELIGLLGATIGDTGQTGSNIGNAMKSVTLALSNPALQKKLRDQFTFEATAGGENIQSMSVILGDLYVKYQHLNDAQRQSLLFQVAGRTQASRMAAMLNNYVKAQTLAVNAQLNLNTAEAENAKIKGALRTQLHGLTAEWERFVLVQGSRGPVQAMTGISTAFRNVLTLMNTPAGSLAATGILGLIGAAGAKSVLTGMRLGSGGGFISRTGAHVRQALGQLNTSMLMAYAGVTGGGVASSTSTRQPLLVPGGGGGLAGRGVNSLYLWSEALLRVGRSSAVSSGLVRGMATALGATTRALGVGLIALRTWLVPLGVIAAATYGFNRAMEGLGLSSEKAESRLAGFNEGAQKAAAAANAYAQAAEALRTAQRAMGAEKGFGPQRGSDMARMLGQVSEAMYVYEPDLDKRDALQKKFREEAEVLRQQGNQAGIINMLEEERNKLVAARREELQKQFVEIRNQTRSVDDEIKRLKGQDGGLFGEFTYGSRHKKIGELERQRAELSEGGVRNIVEQSNAFEERLQYDEKHQTALRTEKLLMESIAEIYASVNGNNAVERADIRKASLEAQNEAIDRQLELLQREDEQGLASERDRAAAMADLQAKETAAREGLAGTEHGHVRGSDQVYSKDSEQIANEKQRLNDELADIERRKQAAAAGITPAGELGFASRGEQRAQLRQQRMGNEEERRAIEANRRMFEAQRDFDFGREQGRRSVGASEYGFSEGDRLLRKKAEIERQVSEIERRGSQGTASPTLGDRGRQLELEREMYQDILQLRERSYTVERDINQLIYERDREFRKSVFGSGPAELLRKMAAFSAAFSPNGQLRNVSAGALLAMSPEMRKDLVGAQSMGMTAGGRLPGAFMDADMSELLHERNRLKGFGGEGNASALDRYLGQLSGHIAQLAGGLKDALPRAEFAAGRAVMSGFNSAVSNATAAVQQFAAVVASVKGGGGGGGGGGAPIEPTGQHGGKGGAEGYTGKSLLDTFTDKNNWPSTPSGWVKHAIYGGGMSDKPAE